MILPSGLEASLAAKGEAWLLLGRTCGYTALFGAVHLALRPVVRLTAIEPKSRGDWINRIIASLHAVVSGVAGTIMLLREEPFSSMIGSVATFTPVDTVHGDSPMLAAFLPLTLGYFAYDCGVMAIDPEVYMTLMVVHHAVSLLVWPISLLSRAGNFYVAWFLATEVSTPLLHATVFFMPKHGIDGGLRTLVGLGLIVVFFFARILPGPAMLHSLWASQPYWSDINPVVTKMAFCTIPIPPFLFGYWFFLLVKGALKALSKEDKKDD
eukprot:TRINITY_DN35835_c0_g1_i1.p1 TRINITY_DN35835_c0_g1~~TRINITY_DN35835_c0_g1_i1.p1  ORF type:complete len:267 (-),score=51.47 TRINITY_DN35835_c0_g1_i1:269-1069(-)